jgi:hypothetical protein
MTMLYDLKGGHIMKLIEKLNADYTSGKFNE